MSKKVLVAMSGGVDSTISAYLLKKAGYEVKGIHFRFWRWRGKDEDYQKEVDRLNLMSSHLGIEMVTVDAQNTFRERVISQIFEMLAKGLTPNPCIHCNPMMKFDQLLKYAEIENADFVATGHYVISQLNDEGNVSLIQAVDKSKDQSYFLCQLDQHILKRTIFPLGKTIKEENKQLAVELGLSFEEKPESQDLCFLTNQSYSDFINSELPEIMKPGKIKDVSGNVIGTHHGLPNYTIGQRKGIEISASKPYYVIEKDIKNNTLIVGNAADLKFNYMIVSGMNWISGKPIEKLSCNVKIRYRSSDYDCSLTKISQTEYRVEFSRNLRDITPGQYAVFYHGEEMLGGGMIVSAD